MVYSGQVFTRPQFPHHKNVRSGTSQGHLESQERSPWAIEKLSFLWLLFFPELRGVRPKLQSWELIPPPLPLKPPSLSPAGVEIRGWERASICHIPEAPRPLGPLSMDKVTAVLPLQSLVCCQNLRDKWRQGGARLHTFCPGRQTLLHPKIHRAPQGELVRDKDVQEGGSLIWGGSQDEICSPSQLERASERRGLLDKGPPNIMLYRGPSLWRLLVSGGGAREREAFLSLSGSRGECCSRGWLVSRQPPPLASPLKARCAPSSWR